MNGCMCGCGGWGYGPRWGYGPSYRRWPTREQRIEQLKEYQRDLEQRAADVADEIKRVNEGRKAETNR